MTNVASNNPGPALITVEEAARRLGIGRTLTYGLVMSGELRSFKIGGRRLVVAESVDDYIRRRSSPEDL